MTSSEPENQHRDIKKHLSPPDCSPEQTSVKPRGSGLLFIVVGFMVLLSVAGGVLFLLPSGQHLPAPTSESVMPENTPELTPEMLGDSGPSLAEKPHDPANDEDRSEASEAREEMTALKIKGESQSLGVWAGNQYKEVLQAMAEADQSFEEKNFRGATEGYRQVSGELQLLLDSKQQIYEAAIEGGAQALIQENEQEAEQFFARALAIDPLSEDAQSGMKRTESLASVISLYQEALALEQTGKPAEAVAQLKKLLELDSAYEPATQALERLEAERKEQAFQKEMNAFLTALEDKDLANARRLFETLKMLGMHPEQISQAGRMLVEQEELAFVAGNRKIADGLEEAEKWQQALVIYDKILVVAPDALFAVHGKTEAAKRAELDSALGDAISRARRLQGKQQRAEAAQLLTYARQINPKGPKLESQIQTLDLLIVRAGTPIAILLESDNKTDVTIYHVGKIGAFFSKKINLKPGTYTVVGSKIGYRDVRKIITIGPDEKTHTFIVRCEEPI